MHVTETDGRAESTRVVGRERELDALRAGLAEVENGRGRPFTISGEPGVSRTRPGGATGR